MTSMTAGIIERMIITRMTSVKLRLTTGRFPKRFAEDKERNPGEAAYDVVGEEFHIGHFADACYEWGEGSDDWDESGQDDGFCAVFFVEAMCAVNMLFFEAPFTLAFKMTSPKYLPTA